jgi:anti-sigma factor RsiW
MRDAVHPDEEIQLLLDGRLPQGAVAALEAHLASCLECASRRDLLAETRRRARSLTAPPLPPGLETRLRAALDGEDATRGRRRWLAVALAAAAVVVLVVLVRAPGSRQDLVAAAAEDVTGGVPIDMPTAEPSQLSRYFRDKGVPATVFDLTAAGFRLEGGRAQVLAGRPSALSAYRGADGRALHCQMYEGRMAELPGGGTVQERGGVTFRVYEREGVTLAFWQEGGVVCVLVGPLAPERLLELAAAKA